MTPPRERQLEERQRPRARAQPLHPVPVISLRIGARLHVAEVGVARRPPARSLDRRVRRAYELAQVRLPCRRRLGPRRLPRDHAGLQDLERLPPPERRVRARSLHLAPSHKWTIVRTYQRLRAAFHLG